MAVYGVVGVRNTVYARQAALTMQADNFFAIHKPAAASKAYVRKYKS